MSAAASVRVRLTVNGRPREADVAPLSTLHELLAERLGCHEVRYGCGEGVCGACLVLKDGVPAASCLVLAAQADGATVMTASGLAQGDDPLSKRYRLLLEQSLGRSAFQCGYCGPGVLVSATHLLATNPSPDEAAVRAALSGNLCRCSGYVAIVESVLAASRGEPPPPGQREDLRVKLDGSAAFPTDARDREALVGGVVWSAHPSARIVTIDTGAAKNLPGVVAVLTHRDIPGRNVGGVDVLAADQPLLAADRVRSMSDAVALVAATDRASLNRALAAIRVTYAPEQPITTVEGALAPGARAIAGRSNIVAQFTHNLGDVDAAFAAADRVCGGSYACGSAEHACIELDGGAAWWEGETLVLAVPTQTPYTLRHTIARALAMPQERVRLEGARAGGSFGRRLIPFFEPWLALLAHRTRRPVRLVLSRREALVRGPKRHAVSGRYRLAVKDNVITALEADVYADVGPYVGVSPTFVSILAFEGAGAYEIANQRIVARGVRTNNPITAPMRGYGSMQASFGIERIVDEAAAQLGLDPVALRRRNLVARRTDGYGRVVPGGTWLKNALDLACERAGPRPAATEGWRVGRGVAVVHAKCGYQYGMVDRFLAKVSVDRNGRFTVSSDVPDSGTGVNAAASRRVAERLGLAEAPQYSVSADLLADPSGTLFATAKPLGRLKTCVFRALEWVLTSGFGGALVLIAPLRPKLFAGVLRVFAPAINLSYGLFNRLKSRWFPFGKDASNPTIGGSRSLFFVGRAAIEAADALRARALELASAALRVPATALAVDATGVHGAEPSLRLSWGQLAEAAGGELSGLGTATIAPGWFLDRKTGNQTGATDFMDAAHICDVAVQSGTGLVKVLRYVAVHDVGRAFDADIVRGQIAGGIVMGIAQAVGENLQLIDGVVHADNMLRYLVPTALDAPEKLEIHLLESGLGLGPDGAKGVGEVGAVAAPSAMASALSDALGVSIASIPQTPATLAATMAASRTPASVKG